VQLTATRRKVAIVAKLVVPHLLLPGEARPQDHLELAPDREHRLSHKRVQVTTANSIEIESPSNQEPATSFPSSEVTSPLQQVQ
jgi:hypothetical protein